MNSQELLETYGKAATVVKSYYLEKFLESMNTTDVPENFKEFAKDKGIDNDTVAKMIELAPRTLFDVFDKYGILIHITIMDDGKEVIFSHHISKAVNSVYAPCSTRIEAERNAVEEAFEILNEKL